jgi:hypothetical protein
VSTVGHSEPRFSPFAAVNAAESTVALNIRGITAEQMIVFGEDYGRAWYATLRLRELSPVEGCYGIDGVALDQPDAVIILHPGEWHGVGLRLPKRDDFRLPDDVFVDSNGLYYMLGEYPHGSFCVDTSGSVFSVPFP